MKYVYGPVRSRRLGFSLGVSTVPYKVCSFDCVYCQLKETTRKTMQRKDYIRVSDITDELKTFFDRHPKDPKLDYVTFSGAGEPTLHAGIGRLIRAVHGMTDVPVVVITNSSTLILPSVRRELLAADVVIPSLDAVTQDIFEKIDRPLKGLSIKDVIGALKRFRRTFGGKLWLEIMLVRGVNDSPVYLKLMEKTVRQIGPDRIQIVAPVRTPSQTWAKVPTKATLKTAKKIFGRGCDIVC